MEELNFVFDMFRTVYGNLMGTGSYDVVSPDYGKTSTPETFVAREIPLRVDLTRGPYPEPVMPHVDFYSVFGNNQRLQAGYVLIPNPSRLNVPVLTLINDEDKKEIVAFRTDRIGSIYASKNREPLYTNVRFDFTGPTAPAPALNPQMQGSPHVQTQRAVFYYRGTAGSSGPVLLSPAQRLFDQQTGIYWMFDEVAVVGEIVEVALKVGG